MKLIITIYLLAWAFAAQAQTPTILLNFNKVEGHPQSFLQGADGNFYVSTSKGLILKVTPAGPPIPALQLRGNFHQWSDPR
jgi:hypothetical protein